MGRPERQHVELGEARAELAAVEAALLAARARSRAAEEQRSDAERRRAEAALAEGEARRRLRRARLDMRARATSAFIRNDAGRSGTETETRGPEFMGRDLQADHEAVDGYRAAEGVAGGRLAALGRQIATATAARDAARSEAAALVPALALARRRLARHEAGRTTDPTG